MEILWLALIATPVCACMAWWFWAKQDRSASFKLRRRLTLMGLLAASINALIYYSWLFYRLAIGSNPLVWRLKDIGCNLGASMALLALAGAIFGKGAARIPVALCALLGLMNWIPVAIL
jgi:hypothetical protein